GQAPSPSNGQSWQFSPFLQPLQGGGVAPVAVLQAPVYPADGGGADPRVLVDLLVVLPGAELAGYQKPLGKGFQFLDGADVLQKTAAFLFGVQGQNGFQKHIQ